MGLIPALFKIIFIIIVLLLWVTWFFTKGSIFITVILLLLTWYIVASIFLFLFSWKGLQKLWRKFPKDVENIFLFFYPPGAMKEFFEKLFNIKSQNVDNIKQKEDGKEKSKPELIPQVIDSQPEKEVESSGNKEIVSNYKEKPRFCANCGTEIPENVLERIQSGNNSSAFCTFCGSELKFKD